MSSATIQTPFAFRTEIQVEAAEIDCSADNWAVRESSLERRLRQLLSRVPESRGTADFPGETGRNPVQLYSSRWNHAARQVLLAK